MGGAFKAAGDVLGGVTKGVTNTVGGVVKGAGQILTGNPIEGLGTAVGGVAKGAGSVLKGGLGAVKNVMGDPLLMGVAGFATFGVGGAIAAPLLGKLGSGIAGTAEQGVSQTFGLDGQQGQQDMMYANNSANFGPNNACMCSGGVGHTAPYPGQAMQPGMVPQSPGMMPPQYGMAPGANGFY